MDPLRITIDTREQRPWSFPPERASAEIGTLRTGDYALAGDECFAVERKSLDDSVGTISSGWDRFQRELDRMEHFPAKIVIVEGSFSELVFSGEGDRMIEPAHQHYNITPAFAMKRLGQLLYQGVAVVFAENPEYSAAVCLSVLKERRTANEQ